MKDELVFGGVKPPSKSPAVVSLKIELNQYLVLGSCHISRCGGQGPELAGRSQEEAFSTAALPAEGLSIHCRLAR